MANNLYVFYGLSLFSITLEFGIFDILFNQCLNIPIMILYFHTLLFLFPKCFDTSTSWTDDSYEEDKCVYLYKPGYFDECLLFVHLLCLYLFYLHCQQNTYVLYKKKRQLISMLHTTFLFDIDSSLIVKAAYFVSLLFLTHKGPCVKWSSVSGQYFSHLV